MCFQRVVVKGRTDLFFCRRLSQSYQQRWLQVGNHRDLVEEKRHSAPMLHRLDAMSTLTFNTYQFTSSHTMQFIQGNFSNLDSDCFWNFQQVDGNLYFLKAKQGERSLVHSLVLLLVSFRLESIRMWQNVGAFIGMKQSISKVSFVLWGSNLIWGPYLVLKWCREEAWELDVKPNCIQSLRCASRNLQKKGRRLLGLLTTVYPYVKRKQSLSHTLHTINPTIPFLQPCHREPIEQRWDCYHAYHATYPHHQRKIS